TGAILFVALEYMIYGPVERLTKLLTEVLAGSSSERWTEMRSWAAQVSSDESLAVQRDLQAAAPPPTERLGRHQQEIAAVDQMYSDEHVKRISDLYLLADNYGAQALRQVMAARGKANAG